MSQANPPESPRGSWKSSLGFILACTGSAVGLGNLWKFPYITHQNGGGAFVLVYLVCILVVGFPIMVGEAMIGRMSQLNPIGAFRKLGSGRPGGKGWIALGGLGVLTGFVILSYYSVVAGWTLQYSLKSIQLQFAEYANEEVYSTAAFEQDLAKKHEEKHEGADGAAYVAQLRQTSDGQEELAEKRRMLFSEKLFLGFLGDPVWQVFWHGFFMVLCIGIVIGGVARGIERWNKILMPVLFGLLAMLMINSLTTKGAGQGVNFLFRPNFSELTAASILEALGHAFFTLSLGMGAILTYGSYLRRKDDVVKAAGAITVMDTVIALMACLTIYPILFTYDIKPDKSIGILFTSLPVVFLKMPAGRIMGVAFYALVSFAALTSAISLLEVVTSTCIDELKWKRRTSTIVVGLVIFLFGIPSALSNSVLSEVKLIGGRNIFDTLDYLASNWFLPVGGLFIAVFAAWLLKQAEQDKELWTDRRRLLIGSWRVAIRFVAPVAVLLVLLNGLGVFG